MCDMFAVLDIILFSYSIKVHGTLSKKDSPWPHALLYREVFTAYVMLYVT